MSAPSTDYQPWLEKADHDLLNIRNNLAATNISWDTVCFHAQQAAEKLLKAFLLAASCMAKRWIGRTTSSRSSPPA